MKKIDERRSYFRINDTIGLSYRTLNDSNNFVPESSGEDGISLAEVLAEIDAKFNQAENTLWCENETIAQALGLLNRKISIIAAHQLQKQDQPTDSYEELLANISGSGMAFGCVKPLPEETRLRVSVVLKPSNIKLHFTAKVVACEPLSSSPTQTYWMRISIDEGNHAAREQLVQHVVQKQRKKII